MEMKSCFVMVIQWVFLKDHNMSEFCFSIIRSSNISLSTISSLIIFLKTAENNKTESLKRNCKNWAEQLTKRISRRSFKFKATSKGKSRFQLDGTSTDQPILSQCTLSLPPENIRKPYGFLVFSGGRERVHWERMG